MSKVIRPVLAAVFVIALGAGVASAVDPCNPCNPCVKRAKVVCKTDPCNPCNTVCQPRRGFRWFGWFRAEPTYYRDSAGYYYY